MNDLILAKMREGDWGEVVRLMREEREGLASMPVAESMSNSGRPMPFRERFDTVRITPQKVADSVVEENGRFKALSIEGEQYKPSQRFLKGMAQRMKVPLSVFELFTPLEANRDLHQDNIRPVSLFEKTPPEADLVVLDEAHHEATQSCVLLYEKMKSEYVLITDGCGPAPENPPPYSVLWILTGDGEKPAPWGWDLRLRT